MPGSRLCLAAREEIRVGVERGDSVREIARLLGRSASTISREIRRNGSRRGYVAHVAHRRARERARRPKPFRLDDRSLFEQVGELLLDCRYSPWAAARLLTSRGIPISHETIYQAIYRGWYGKPQEVLNRPRSRRRRRTRTGQDRRPLGDIRLIGERVMGPGEPGHWEGDLLVGAGNRSAVVVLTERTSRVVKVGALTNQTAPHVAQVVERLLASVPPPLRKTLTWDQGRELARWPTLQHQLGIEVFFCQPRSPWQKPLVENVCGLLRRWLPRQSNLYRPQPELDHYTHLLNTMPRRILENGTAQTRYHQLRVATTD